MYRISEINSIYYKDIRNRNTKINVRDFIKLFSRNDKYCNMYNVNIYNINPRKIGYWRNKIESLSVWRSRSFYNNNILTITFDNIRELNSFLRNLISRYPGFIIDVDKTFTNF